MKDAPMNASPLRYFLVVGLNPSHNLAVLAAVTVIGLWTVAMSPGELDSALGMLMFVQMFLASTGFLVRARRGHFDPILTSASERTAVVSSHWLASALPGVLACSLVCGVDWMYGGGGIPSAAAGRRLLALSIVSGVSWIAGFALTRGAAGALWTAGLVAVLLERVDLLGSAPITVASSTSLLVIRHALAVIGCPFLLLGTRAPLAPGSIAAAGCTAALCLLTVWRSVECVDFYLRDRA
jgi:hypothetical protein